MRVIKENLKEKIHKCENCGSVYAYTAKDINYCIYETIRCPICQSLNQPSIFDRKVR